MLKKTVKNAVVGFLIGMVTGNVIAILTGTSDTGGVTFASQKLLDISGGNGVVAMLLQTLFSGLYGAVCFAGMSLYEAERLSLAAATALHCALIVLLFIPISLLLGWVGSIVETVIIASIQIAAFFMIWLILWKILNHQNSISNPTVALPVYRYGTGRYAQRGSGKWRFGACRLQPRQFQGANQKGQHRRTDYRLRRQKVSACRRSFLCRREPQRQ